MSMTNTEIQKLAQRDGITIDSVKTRIRKYGEQGAREFQPMTRSQRGRKGKSNSPWRKFVLPGSPFQGGQ